MKSAGDPVCRLDGLKEITTRLDHQEGDRALVTQLNLQGYFRNADVVDASEA